MSTRTNDDLRIHDFLDRHDPDLVLAAFRDRQGGPAHMRRLGSMARAALRDGTKPRRILDLFCGPGDLGRTLGLLERDCTVDFVDSDPFALALCSRINRRRRVRGRLFRRDLWDPRWAANLDGRYDVIAVNDGLRHLDPERIAEVLEDLILLLREGGQLLFSEPTPPSGDDEAKDREAGAEWHSFFRRLDRHLGYPERRGLVSNVPPGRHPIDDDGLPIRDYLRLLANAGFTHAEVVDRGSRHVCIRAAHESWRQKAA